MTFRIKIVILNCYISHYYDIFNLILIMISKGSCDIENLLE